MKKIGNWHVGDVVGGKRRAMCMTEKGVYLAVQPRGGGALFAMQMECSAEVYARLLEAQGEIGDEDSKAIIVLAAMEIPDGLQDALLA